MKHSSPVIENAAWMRTVSSITNNKRLAYDTLVEDQAVPYAGEEWTVLHLEFNHGYRQSVNVGPVFRIELLGTIFNDKATYWW